MPLLFILFTVIPLVELALLFKLGSVLGPWTALALVIGTGMAGAALARWQGWRAATRVREEVSRGVLPASAMIDGVLIFVAGVLLITPGVLTDALGLALLIPPARAGMRRAAASWLKRHVRVDQRVSVGAGAWADSPLDESLRDRPRDQIIDVQVVDEPAVRDDP